MEMLELNNANQNVAVNGNGAYTNQHQQILASQQNLQAQQQQQQMNLSPTHMYRSHPSQQVVQQQGNLKYANNHKISKHRELPVDVPDSFVGMAKQSPRYPPPKPHRQVSPPMPLNSMTTFNHTQQQQQQTQQILPFSSNDNPQRPSVPPLSPNTAANVAHNISLRSSIKLKQLEKTRGAQHGNFPVGQMQPAINQAFELNEDDSARPPPDNNQQYNNTCLGNHQVNTSQQQQSSSKAKQSVPDLRSIYNRLQPLLNGEFSDVAGDAKFAKILSIYNTLAHTRGKQFRVPNLVSRHATVNVNGNQEPLTYKVTDLLQSVASMLREGDQLTEEAVELMPILYMHEMEGVCSAFDKIIQSFEFAKITPPPTPQSSELILDNNNGMYQHQQEHQMYSHNQGMQQYVGPMGGYEYAPDQVQMDIENNLYPNSLHPLTDIDLSDGLCIKMVQIERGSNIPLGATIKNEEDGSVVIGRIICGGDAASSGSLHEGDEILEINGIPMRGKNINEVVHLLERMNGTLTFKINVRNISKPPQRPQQEKILVKTFFDYNADDDTFMPVKELGLSFEKGEILEIIDRSDAQWWQARREGETNNTLARLIPSVNFLEQRREHLNHGDLAATYFKNEKKNLVSLLFNCPKGSSPRRRKKPLELPKIPYYEEVCPYYPIKYSKRPIFLVGIRHIGQREIIDKFVQSDPNRFASPITQTSKPRLDHERNGVDFHFVSRAQFEHDIKAGKLIEYGLHQSHWYGTSVDVIKEIVQQQKTCLHMIAPQYVLSFRQSRAGAELKPYFVFLRPDDSHPDKLRNLVASFMSPKSSIKDIEENVKAVVSQMKAIEAYYRPYLDSVINFSDIDRAFQALKSEIERIANDPQWIPMDWKDKPIS